jgi:TIR domain-containing protein
MQLFASLRQRGVDAWLDQEDIDPGAEFPDWIEQGIQESCAFGIVITPASMHSQRVRRELSIALELHEQHRIRLIPIRLSPGEPLLPELRSHNYVDFAHDRYAYEHLVDRLAWPGITGKEVQCVALTGDTEQDGAWELLRDVMQAYRMHLSSFGDLTRAERHIRLMAEANAQTTRVVVFVDLLEGRAHSSPAWGELAPKYTPTQYAELVQRIRATYRETNPVTFVLYQRSEAVLGPCTGVDPQTAREFTSLFTLNRAATSRAVFAQEFRVLWNRVLADLMLFERRRYRPGFPGTGATIAGELYHDTSEAPSERVMRG